MFFSVSACLASCCACGDCSFSDANVDCEVAFSDSDCEFVQPQTLSPVRKREASVALEPETEMNIEGPPVKAVPKNGQKKAHAAKFAFHSRTRMYETQSAAATRRDAFATNGDVVTSGSTGCGQRDGGGRRDIRPRV